MIKNVFAYFNVEAGFFNHPFYVNEDKEVFVENSIQSLAYMPVKLLEAASHNDLYYLGTFDNISCEFTAAKEFVCHFGVYAKEWLDKRLKEKEVQANDENK